jgi:hypothetical protein
VATPSPAINLSRRFLARNPHKLFLALEYVLASGGEFVTHNAYLENGTVSCRQSLLQPGHVDGEILDKFSPQEPGTTMGHRQALERIAVDIVISSMVA